MPIPARIALASLLLCLSLNAAHAAATRTHVSNGGNDANAAFSCDYAHPCRTFAVALANTTAGGEILAIDSSGYGKVTIDRSVAIIAAPGVFAGIGVGAGGNATGVDIATAGVKVVLRGLTITGQGGTNGIRMTDGSQLSIENCVISGFPEANQNGVFVGTAADVRLIDSVVRNNYIGIRLQGGANAEISGARLIKNSWYGIVIYGNVAATTTTAAISETLVVGDGPSSTGIWSYTITPSATSRASVTRSTITRAGYGVYAYASTGTALMVLADSLVAGNTSYGLAQGQSGGGSATFRTLGSSTVIDNGHANASLGTITPIAPL